MPNILTRSFLAIAQKLNPQWLGFSSYSDVPQAVHMNRSYKTYAKDGYKNSDTLYKCISYLIRNGAAIPPVLYVDATKKKTIDKHPLLDKLNKPNNEQSGVAYREAVLGYKLLAGNSFQYAIRAGKNTPPDELWALRPDKVEILIQPRKGIVAYKYEDMDAQIDAANIGHTKYWNADDDKEPGMGMSPVEAAALNVDMQIAAKKWNLGMLQNGARPPGIWKVPTLMGVNERRKLEEKLNEKFAGAKAAGKSPLFDGGLDWKSTVLAPAQMDYLDSLKYNGGSIANILNMAPQLVGDTGAQTYDNMKQAKIWSYTEGIFPELDDLYGMWQNWLVPMYPDLASSGAFLYYDKESVEVIQELIQAQKDAQSQRANDLWLNGICLQNEARELAGLPSSPEGDVWRIGAILVPKGKLQEYAEQSLSEPAAPPMPQPEPLPPPTTIEEVPPEEPPRQLLAPKKSVKALNLTTSAQKKAHMDSMESLRGKWETKAEARLQSYFRAEKKAVVAAINSAAIPATAELRAEHALKAQGDSLKGVLISLYQDVVSDVGLKISKELKGVAQQYATKDAISDFTATFGSDVLDYLESLAGQKISQINDTTLSSIRNELKQGVAAGESIPALAKRIDGLYLSKIIPNRSTNIARTEVTGASNYGSMQAAKQSGLMLNKVWLATEDSRTRADHVDADGQEVGIDEDFDIGDVKMAYPGDPQGGAAEICNCRCTTYYNQTEDVKEAYKEDDSGSFDDMSIADREAFIAENGGDSWEESLTNGQQDALEAYGSDYYKDMNRALRHGDYAYSDVPKAELDRYINDARAALMKNGAPTDMTVTRRLRKEKLSAFQAGKHFVDHGFVSTSLDSNISSEYGDVLVSLLLPKSTPGGYIKNFAQFPDDYEWLLPPDAKFEVVSVKGNQVSLKYVGIDSGTKSRKSIVRPATTQDDAERQRDRFTWQPDDIEWLDDVSKRA